MIGKQKEEAERRKTTAPSCEFNYKNHLWLFYVFLVQLRSDENEFHAEGSEDCGVNFLLVFLRMEIEIDRKVLQ